MRILNKDIDNQIMIAISVLVVLVLILLGIGVTTQNKKERDAKKQAQEEMLKNSRKLYAEGKYGKMISDLNGYLKNNPGDFEAHAMLSTVYIVTGKLPEAYKETQKLYAHKANPDIAYQLGVIADKMGKESEAIDYLKASVKASPDSLPFHIMLADLYFKSTKYNEAIDEWNILLKLLPKDSAYKKEIYNKLVTAYNALGDRTKANEAANNASSLQR